MSGAYHRLLEKQHKSVTYGVTARNQCLNKQHRWSLTYMVSAVQGVFITVEYEYNLNSFSWKNDLCCFWNDQFNYYDIILVFSYNLGLCG